jgi:O-methyltransferase
MATSIAGSGAASDEYLELLKDCLTGAMYDESAWKLIDGSYTGRFRISKEIRKWFLKALAKRGLRLVKANQFDAEKRAEGMDWPLFGYTMVGRKRLDQLQLAIEQIAAEGIQGDLLEAGVWRGGASLFMKATLNRLGLGDRKLWLADSFEGLPRPKQAADTKHRGHDLSNCDFLKVPQEDVVALFERFGLLDGNVKFLKGWFCDSLQTAQTGPLALLRLDGDLYESTMDILKPLYSKVVPGGFVVVDDFYTWAGCRDAIHEFRETHQINAEIHRIDASGAFWRVPLASSSAARAA